jgi:hypothetical protein
MKLADSTRLVGLFVFALLVVAGSSTWADDLTAQIGRLASPDRSVRLAAEEVLWQTPQESAATLSAWIARSTGDAALPAALALLKRLRRGELFAETVAGILDDSNREIDWPHVLAALDGRDRPELAKRLLGELDLSQPEPQNTAILAAVAKLGPATIDSIPVLLPWWLSDQKGPAAHAMTVSAQAIGSKLPPAEGEAEKEDETQPDWRANLDAVERSLLDRAVEQLPKLADSEHGELRRAARRLSLALGLREAEELRDLKIHSVSMEINDHAASNLVNGDFGTRTASSQWRSIDRGVLPWVIIDLGESATVSRIEIANYYQAREKVQGLKRIAIEVSDEPTVTRPQLAVELPQAPDSADDAAFFQRYPMDFVVGKYLIIRALSTHSGTNDGGLHAIRVFGLPD